MERFDFICDPLDIALRRLLMDLSLPKETQQIDRVMEAFAKRYTDCNPGLFASGGTSLAQQVNESQLTWNTHQTKLMF
jgi:Sec7-like guanine-nucleotide exchange factor